MIKFKEIKQYLKFNICDLYILIWLLYYFHWYAEDTVPSLEPFANVFLGLNLVISAFCFRKVFTTQKLSTVFIAINCLLVLYVVYGTLAILIDPVIRHKGHNVNNSSYIVGPLRTFLPIYAFYLFTRLGYLTKTKIQMWFFVFLAETLYLNYQNQFLRFGREVEELYTNNIGYLFAGLFPFVYFFKKKPLVQNAIIALLCVFTIQAMKRGAILIGVVCTLLYIKDKFKNMRKKSDILAVFLMIIAAWYVVSFTSKTYQTSENFQERWEKTKRGNDSKRGKLRRELIRGFYLEADFTRAFFGLGANGTLKITTNWAHNDWIETLVDNGYVGLSCYAFFWVSFFLTWWRKMKKMPLEFRVMEMVIISGLIRTYFSMWYNNSNMFVTLPIGYCLAQLSLSQEKEAEEKRKEIINAHLSSDLEDNVNEIQPIPGNLPVASSAIAH